MVKIIEIHVTVRWLIFLLCEELLQIRKKINNPLENGQEHK